jgi:hypothetical protein
VNALFTEPGGPRPWGQLEPDPPPDQGRGRAGGAGPARADRETGAGAPFAKVGAGAQLSHSTERGAQRGGSLIALITPPGTPGATPGIVSLLRPCSTPLKYWKRTLNVVPVVERWTTSSADRTGLGRGTAV